MVPKRLSPEYWHDVALERHFRDEAHMLTELGKINTVYSLSQLLDCTVPHLRNRIRATGSPWPSGKPRRAERECPECLVWFTPDTNSQKTCSLECKDIRTKRWQAEYRQRFKGKGRGPTYEPSVRSRDLAGRPKPKQRKEKRKCSKCSKLLSSYNWLDICWACQGPGFVSTEATDVKNIAR